MTDLTRMPSTLFNLFKQAVHESVQNLPATFVSNIDININADILKAMLLLLEYHPEELVRKFYIKQVQALLDENK